MLHDDFCCFDNKIISGIASSHSLSELPLSKIVTMSLASMMPLTFYHAVGYLSHLNINVTVCFGEPQCQGVSCVLVNGCRRLQAIFPDFSRSVPRPRARVCFSSFVFLYGLWRQASFCMDLCGWSMWNIVFPKLFLRWPLLFILGSISTHYFCKRDTLGDIRVRRRVFHGTIVKKVVLVKKSHENENESVRKIGSMWGLDSLDQSK